MERCGDPDEVDCSVRASQGIDRSINHVRPCRGKHRWWVWTEWDVSRQMKGGFSASGHSDLKARTVSRLYFRLNSSLEIAFFFFLTSKEAQSDHKLYFKCTHITQTLCEPKENHTLVQQSTAEVTRLVGKSLLFFFFFWKTNVWQNIPDYKISCSLPAPLVIRRLSNHGFKSLVLI